MRTCDYVTITTTEIESSCIILPNNYFCYSFVVDTSPSLLSLATTDLSPALPYRLFQNVMSVGSRGL